MNRPNILLVLTDQQRHDTIAAAGHPHMRTPTMDRILREGRWYANAYTPNPVCMPARQCLLTGASERDHRCYDNIEVTPDGDPTLPTIPRACAAAGYYTAAVGKMHFRPVRHDYGYQRLLLMEEIPNTVAEDEYAQFLVANGFGHVQGIHGQRPYLYYQPQVGAVPARLHGSAWVADRVIDCVEEASAQPFFICAGWIHPHPPFDLPADWPDLYRDVELPEAIPTFEHPQLFPRPNLFRAEGETPAQRRATRAAYANAVSLVDQQLGRVLAHLERTGRLDDTLVILTSDHGEMLQDHGFYEKYIPFESATRIPLALRCPRLVAAGGRDDRFVDLFDIFPTILDAGGVALERRRQLMGRSLIDGAVPARRYQHCSWGLGHMRWASVRDDRFKYVHFYNHGVDLFFDLIADPQERRDLVGEQALPMDDFRRLRAACVAREAEHAPPGSIVDGDFDRSHAVSFRDMTWSKFPDFANMQFPLVGAGPVERRWRAHLRELVAAARRLDQDRPISAVCRDPCWAQEWTRHFVAFGGPAAIAQRFLDTPLRALADAALFELPESELGARLERLARSAAESAR